MKIKAKETINRVTVSLNSDIFNQLPSHHRDAWIREAIAEKLERENRLIVSSTESKAISRIVNPIKEEEWITMGTLEEKFDLEQVNQEIRERGYAG
jgi:CRISPR/Cas system endoribonuclease Cas6 (RAMP superfamily)